jgi:membrane protease YdiL (CAAX protease family)
MIASRAADQSVNVRRGRRGDPVGPDCRHILGTMAGQPSVAESEPGGASGGSIAPQLGAFLALWLVTAGALVAGSVSWLRVYSRGTAFTAAIMAAFFLQLGLYWLPGFDRLRARLEAALPGRSLLLVVGGALLAPYFVYALGTGALAPVPALKQIGLVALVFAIYGLWPPRHPGLSLQDVIVMAGIATPVYVKWYDDIWPVPVHLDFMQRLFVVGVAAFGVLSLRRLPDVGYQWRLRGGDWIEAGKQFLGFAIIGLPAGYAMRFIAWHPKEASPLPIAFSFLGIFLLIAVAEELFFRGMLQNLLEKRLGNIWAARAIASALFGLSHIHHGFPNWRYVIMAAIAGWFYGTAWHRRRSIIASSLTHAAVDTLWRHFLTI